MILDAVWPLHISITEPSLLFLWWKYFPFVLSLILLDVIYSFLSVRFRKCKLYSSPFRITRQHTAKPNQPNTASTFQNNRSHITYLVTAQKNSATINLSLHTCNACIQKNIHALKHVCACMRSSIDGVSVTLPLVCCVSHVTEHVSQRNWYIIDIWSYFHVHLVGAGKH